MEHPSRFPTSLRSTCDSGSGCRRNFTSKPSYNLYHPYMQLLRGTVTRFQNSTYVPDEKTRKSVNHLTPNGHYMGRNAQLTSRCCILNIYSTNIRTEYFKHAA